jgi:hypothetical protein
MGLAVSFFHGAGHCALPLTDEVYSGLSDEEVHTRVGKLGKGDRRRSGEMESEFQLFQQFLEWRKQNK